MYLVISSKGIHAMPSTHSYPRRGVPITTATIAPCALWDPFKLYLRKKPRCNIISIFDWLCLSLARLRVWQNAVRLIFYAIYTKNQLFIHYFIMYMCCVWARLRETQNTHKHTKPKNKIKKLIHIFIFIVIKQQ